MSTPSDGPAGRATGVIHDIGYRHYAGERLGRSAIARSLYVDSLRGAFGLGRSGKSKIAPFLLLGVMCVPALAVAIGATITPTTEPPFPLTHYPFFVYVLVCLYVGGQAPASVSRDLRFRTTSLYFSRPLRRGDYVAAKFAALTTAVALVLLVPVLVLVAGLLLSDVPTDDVLVGFAQTLLVVAVLAPVLGGIGLAIASVTPRRGMGVAAVVAVLVVLWGLQGALQNLAVVNDREDVAPWTTLASPGTVVDGLVAWVFDLQPAAGVGPEGAQGLVWLLAAAALAAGAYGFLTYRYRKVSVS